MKNILLIFGTRPEAIKMAPLVHELKNHPTHFDVKVCVTAQHRKMLDQVLDLFEIVPDYDLNIMKPGQDLYDVTSRVLLGIRDVLKKEMPSLVLVHGDTTTSTTAALAAFYQKIVVGHVEAGLRTHNIYSPWPEEMNRQLTRCLATYHFAPTPLSKQNLLTENVDEATIAVTGNTVIDALYWVIDKMKHTSNLKNKIFERLANENITADSCNSWTSGERKLVLITGHRRENFGQGFINICESIKELAEMFPAVDFVYPMHLNPNVRKPITEVFNNYEIPNKSEGPLKEGNVFFIEPLDYLPFVYLMNASYIVLTDSGGIQEEAPSLGKPVLVMRDTTERPEALAAGTVRLVGTDKQTIINEVNALLTDEKRYDLMSNASNPYGIGKAANSIVEFIKKI